MPRTRECDYCGADIEPGTGTMFVETSGTTIHFCSSKCENNADLGREARNLGWTDAGRQTTAAEDEAAAEAAEQAAAEEAADAAEEADADEDSEEEAADADEAEETADEEAESDADEESEDADEETEEAEA